MSWNDQRMTVVQHARDIADEDFLAAMKTVMDVRGFHGFGANRWDIAAVLAGHPERIDTSGIPSDDIDAAVPPKVVLAKANRLIKRGLIDGCTCGCRGDFDFR